MPYPSRYFDRLVKFLIIIPLFAELIWLTGCATQGKTVNTSHEKEAVSVKEERGITEESLRCITCHEDRGVAHGWIADWEGSKHARKGVGCESCHITSALEPAVKEASELEYLYASGSSCEDKRVSRQVIAGSCGKCHTKQYNEFMKSRHSIGWKRMLDCGQSIEISKETRSANCEQCHNIQFKCDSCHTRHTFNTLEAKTPEACMTCHMGSDQPHYDMYISSKHGAVYTASQSSILKESESIRSLRSPICVTCHMPQGTHDISFGLAYGPVGGELSYIDRNGIAVDESRLAERRNAMLSVCNACHSPRFAKEKLTAADTIHRNVESIVREAEEIINGLERDNLIIPPINKRVNIQSLGHAIILGNQQSYSNKSRIERLFFKLTYSAKVTWKGAYHANPNHTHLYGWAALQNDLSDMKEEARKLREEAEVRRKMEIRLR
ncbi:MAG: hypothetical protein A2069_04275 [Planctomycetes bacterium GWB2_41_19]|nr:MAG: hypothetical protein A2069_04275 [Planctomycetes bacterium GWB2_41_19]